MYYELVQLDENDAVKSRTVRDCETEAEAVEFACTLAEDCDVEIWCGGQRITIVTASVKE